MENKKINLSFCIVVVAFLLIFYIIINNFNSRRLHEFSRYVSTITGIVKQKNYVIKVLSGRLVAEMKENQDLKNTLTETRNDLDLLSKKLSQQQAPVAVVAAPAVPAPVAASATK